MTTEEGPEQLALVPSSAPARKRKAKPALEPATELPVARVAVDVSLPHLDRLFDYSVPTTLDEQVVPGCRIKVRFAGQLVDGWVVERVAASDHDGTLAFIAKVVSSEPVLVPEIVALARSIADRYAGTLGDVVRLAIPPRHARAEAASPALGVAAAAVAANPSSAYPAGDAFVTALRAGEAPRAVWSVLPPHDPARLAAEWASAALSAGRGAVICVPDVRDVRRWDAVFSEVLGAGVHVVLTSAQTPAERYRSFLAVSRGQVQVVLGTRGAAYAPVRQLGLVVIWDDGDDLHAEPRAPYPHTREVLLTRAGEACAVVVAAHARTAEAQSLVESGWCTEVVADDSTRRSAWPTVRVTDGSTDGSAPVRLPPEVFKTIREASGAVLVQVPRRGYRAALTCQTCRASARCQACSGPLTQASAAAPPTCRWCARPEPHWQCPACSGTALRSPVVGQLRTAEEFGKAFDVPVITSGGATVLDEVESGRKLVLATPGAEPHVAGGYEAVILLDTWLMLGRMDARVTEEAHRRWFNALALAAAGAEVVAVGDAATLQGLVRADPAGVAQRELTERAETHLPPTARLATIDAPADLVAEFAGRGWTPATEVLGPVPLASRDEEVERLILRAPRREGAALAEALKALAAERSAAKKSAVRIQVDPHEF